MFPGMKKLDFMTEYEDRLFVDWTNPSANYGRYLDDEKYFVHAILTSRDNCIGSLPAEYFRIHLKFDELQKMFNYEIDNHDWIEYLKSRSGVYLILDTLSGDQYIGSAYGELGFYGRWSDYAQKKDGNIGLLGKEYAFFEFSIIHEVLNSASEYAIRSAESELKISLGTKVFGLNHN
jgi:hypothetical protein